MKPVPSFGIVAVHEWIASACASPPADAAPARAAQMIVRPSIFLSMVLALSACVNTRVFSEAELNEVGRGCGLAMGEVIQEPTEPRFLFIFAIGPTLQQVGCVRQFARRHNMHLSWIEGVDFEQ